MVPIFHVIMRALQFTGGHYVFGTENDRRDYGFPPSTWIDRVRLGTEKIIGTTTRTDCSELVQNACQLAGVQPPMPDGSWIQYQHCTAQRTNMPVAHGIGSYGRLLFRFTGDPMAATRPRSAHVALSLGDGRTFEARGSRWLVGVHSALDRGWTHAASIPGVDYGAFPVQRWNQ